MAWPEVPFCPLAVPMHFHNRGIHHRIFHVWLLAHRVKQALKYVGLDPVSEALEHRVPLAELWRQVSPRAACAGNPQHCLNEAAVVCAASPRITWFAKAVRLHLVPLRVCQYPSNAHAPIASHPFTHFRLILNRP